MPEYLQPSTAQHTGPPPGTLAPPGWDQGPVPFEAPEPEVNLMEYVLLVWSRRWVVLSVLVVTVALAAAWAFTRPRLYRSSCKVAITIPPQISSSQVDPALSYWNMDRYIRDQLEILKTVALAAKTSNRLGLGGASVDQGAAMLLSGLKVEPIRETNVMMISMVGTDPQRVSEWVNVYVNEYIESNIADGIERSRQVYDVIQSRLSPLRDQLVRSEQQMVEFREREDALLFADQSKNVISEQVNTLTTEYAQAKAERIRLETRLSAVRHLQASDRPGSAFPAALDDTTIQGLRSQRNVTEMDLAEKLQTLKEGHPQVKELRSRLASLDARLRGEVDTLRRSLEADYAIASQREQTLFSNIQQLRSESIELSKQTLEYDRLMREYEQNKAFLEDMLARSKEADISMSATLNNLRVIEPAVPASAPFSPNVPRTIAMALVLGLFLGVGLVVGVDFLDQTLRSPDHVERHTGLEVLSVLPKFSEDTVSALRESFQSLRTALILASRGEGCQVVLVTSSVPGEGKTTVVFNLGKVLAAAGARVLLVDGDLRKPRLHRMINVKNVRGLTSVVLGERDLGEVIHALADVPNMDLVTSGPLPPNPPELYGKASFARLIAKAREQYDWVILDAPPVASVTDPVVASMQVDMALMVVEYGSARRQLVRDCVRQLGRTGVRIAGVLFNKVDVEREHYYYTYYYSHYYRYGYGDTETAPAKGKKKAAEAQGA